MQWELLTCHSVRRLCGINTLKRYYFGLRTCQNTFSGFASRPLQSAIFATPLHEVVAQTLLYITNLVRTNAAMAKSAVGVCRQRGPRSSALPHPSRLSVMSFPTGDACPTD